MDAQILAQKAFGEAVGDAHFQAVCGQLKAPFVHQLLVDAHLAERETDSTLAVALSNGTRGVLAHYRKYLENGAEFAHTSESRAGTNGVPSLSPNSLFFRRELDYTEVAFGLIFPPSMLQLRNVNQDGVPVPPHFASFYLDQEKASNSVFAAKNMKDRDLKLLPAQLLALYNKTRSELQVTYPQVLKRCIVDNDTDVYRGLFEKDLEQLVADDGRWYNKRYLTGVSREDAQNMVILMRLMMYECGVGIATNRALYGKLELEVANGSSAEGKNAQRTLASYLPKHLSPESESERDKTDKGAMHTLNLTCWETDCTTTGDELVLYGVVDGGLADLPSRWASKDGEGEVVQEIHDRYSQAHTSAALLRGYLSVYDKSAGPVLLGGSSAGRSGGESARDEEPRPKKCCFF